MGNTWWRHQMETFSTLLALCRGNSPVTGEFPSQRPVTRSFDVFFDLRLNKRLSKQSCGWWFETQSRPLWRRCNDNVTIKWIYPKSHLTKYAFQLTNSKNKDEIEITRTRTATTTTTTTTTTQQQLLCSAQIQNKTNKQTLITKLYCVWV